MLSVAPAYVAMLRQTDLIGRLDFSSLRFPLIGSAPAGGDIVRQVRELLRVRLLPTYGTTEAGPVFQHPYHEDCPLTSCGRVMAGSEVKLVDPQTGREGVAGELWIRNEFCATGYWGRPELTAQRFVGEWYRTGDLMERDADGNFYFRGRTDDVFNVGGEKVSPAEVENLLHTHPAILAASVVPIPHPANGAVPAAMVILVAGATATEEEIKAFCLARGPAYAHPRRILFVDAFPVGDTGKIDRQRVKQVLANLD